MKKRLFSALLLLALSLSLTASALASFDSYENLVLSEEGLHFIRRYEPFEEMAHQIGDQWYIGYGTPCEKDAYPNGITEEEADLLLERALAPSVNTVRGFFSQHKLEVEQHQFDAMVSFNYALGSSWTSTSYRIAKHLLSGVDSIEPTEVVDSMAVWCHVKSQVDEQQLQRRIDEARLLLHGDYSSDAAPEYYALILDPAGGSVINDTVCYPAGAPYQTLPTATRAGYRLEHWCLENGDALTAERAVGETLRVGAKWVPASGLSFFDVNEGDWFFSYVYDLYRAGVISGHSAEEFAPQDSVTLSQALKLVLLAAGHQAQTPSGKHWASGYLDYAVQKSFLSSGTQQLDQAISRLSIAQLASKALQLPNSAISSPFSDCSDAAVLSLYQAKIVEGSEEGGSLVFHPESNITRAEISAVIWRMANYTEENKPQPPSEPDRSQQIQFQGKWFDILPTVPVNPYQKANYYTSDGRIHYRSNSYSSKTGVDVSVYQNNIDWKKVKDDGIDFAIIRVGGRGWGSEGNIYNDRLFAQNIEGAIAAGLDVGVYFFSQAITVEEAREEARYTLNAIKPYQSKITYPVVFDWERIGGSESRTYNLATSTLCAAANAFCSTVEAAGYEAMIYFNCDVGYQKYDLSKILGYKFWFAQYGVATPTFYYGFDIWQYSSSGSVDGIPGRTDMNIEYIKR